MLTKHRSPRMHVYMVNQEDYAKKQKKRNRQRLQMHRRKKCALAGKRMDGWKGVIDTVRASLGLGGIRFSYEWLKEMTHLHLDQSERSVCVCDGRGRACEEVHWQRLVGCDSRSLSTAKKRRKMTQLHTWANTPLSSKRCQTLLHQSLCGFTWRLPLHLAVCVHLYFMENWNKL